MGETWRCAGHLYGGTVSRTRCTACAWRGVCTVHGGSSAWAAHSWCAVVARPPPAPPPQTPPGGLHLPCGPDASPRPPRAVWGEARGMGWGEGYGVRRGVAL